MRNFEFWTLLEQNLKKVAINDPTCQGMAELLANNKSVLGEMVKQLKKESKEKWWTTEVGFSVQPTEDASK